MTLHYISIGNFSSLLASLQKLRSCNVRSFLCGNVLENLFGFTIKCYICTLPILCLCFWRSWVVCPVSEAFFFSCKVLSSILYRLKPKLFNRPIKIWFNFIFIHFKLYTVLGMLRILMSDSMDDDYSEGKNKIAYYSL